MIEKDLSPPGRLSELVGPASLRGDLEEGAPDHAAHARAEDTDIRAQRTIVDAFFAATRDGDLDAPVAVLDPDVVGRSHGRERVIELRGA